MSSPVNSDKPAVVLCESDPAWVQTYEDLRLEIWRLVSPFATAIEHVGSTSVANLPAKPVIDIDIVVPDREASDATIAALVAAGYVHRGDLGIPFRESMQEPEGSPRHNLYVCLDGCLALNNHLVFRDHLRQNSVDAMAYGNLKRRLAQEHADDLPAYVEGKTAFILEILSRYEFDQEALHQILQVNRRPD